MTTYFFMIPCEEMKSHSRVTICLYSLPNASLSLYKPFILSSMQRTSFLSQDKHHALQSVQTYLSNVICQHTIPQKRSNSVMLHPFTFSLGKKITSSCVQIYQPIHLERPCHTSSWKIGKVLASRSIHSCIPSKWFSFHNFSWTENKSLATIHPPILLEKYRSLLRYNLFTLHPGKRDKPPMLQFIRTSSERKDKVFSHHNPFTLLCIRKRHVSCITIQSCFLPGKIQISLTL